MLRNEENISVDIDNSDDIDNIFNINRSLPQTS
jgi:hypothetical protein